MRTFIVLLVLLIAAVNYRIWVSDDGMVAVWQLKQQVQTLREENMVMARRNDRLKLEVRDLQQGTEAIEARARRELGMIGKDEVLYQFAEP